MAWQDKNEIRMVTETIRANENDPLSNGWWVCCRVETWWDIFLL
jgi:hypothetical protein